MAIAKDRHLRIGDLRPKSPAEPNHQVTIKVRQPHAVASAARAKKLYETREQFDLELSREIMRLDSAKALAHGTPPLPLTGTSML
jgi:hypothetical protein